MNATVSWTDLPDLLHDARLLQLRWIAGWLRRSRISLSFECLRRNVDGSELSDRTVELRSPVRALALAYDSTDRPSEFKPQHVYTANDLRAWQYGGEVGVWVNRPDMEEQVLDALRIDWLAGSSADLPKCRYRVGLSFGYGQTGFMMLFGVDQLKSFAGGRSLSLDNWTAQHAAWWDEWRSHWDAKQESPEAETQVREETVIPAGVDPPPDPNYPWPAEPLIAWEPTDAPAELLAALTAWCEAEIRKSPEDSYLGNERFYARQVDSWWVEGKRAGVTVRGVEHSQPAGEFPAGNNECVQQFLLRRKPNGWVAHPLSRGWPPYGSAPARPAAEKPWLSRWRSGAILSERSSPSN